MVFFFKLNITALVSQIKTQAERFCLMILSFVRVYKAIHFKAIVYKSYCGFFLNFK